MRSAILLILMIFTTTLHAKESDVWERGQCEMNQILSEFEYNTKSSTGMFFLYNHSKIDSRAKGLINYVVKNFIKENKYREYIFNKYLHKNQVFIMMFQGQKEYREFIKRDINFTQCHGDIVIFEDEELASQNKNLWLISDEVNSKIGYIGKATRLVYKYVLKEAFPVWNDYYVMQVEALIEKKIYLPVSKNLDEQVADLITIFAQGLEEKNEAIALANQKLLKIKSLSEMNSKFPALWDTLNWLFYEEPKIIDLQVKDDNEE